MKCEFGQKITRTRACIIFKCDWWHYIISSHPRNRVSSSDAHVDVLMVRHAAGCPEGRYGVQCLELCACENQAACSPEDGRCTCLPGWTGQLCENRKSGSIVYSVTRYYISTVFQYRGKFGGCCIEATLVCRWISCPYMVWITIVCYEITSWHLTGYRRV